MSPEERETTDAPEEARGEADPMSPEEKETTETPEEPPRESRAQESADEGRVLPPATFGTFLQVMASQCFVFLGAVPNPASGKPEPDLPQAKYTIDLLAIVEEKTRGNLSPEEDRLLQAILCDARLRYVEACKT